MTGVLIVAHGSRENGTENTMEAIRDYVQEELGMEHIVEAYMEFRATNIAAGIQKLIDRGADDIKMCRIFCLKGCTSKRISPLRLPLFKRSIRM